MYKILKQRNHVIDQRIDDSACILDERRSYDGDRRNY